MMELPEELVCEIMHLLPHCDLGRLNQVCKDLHRIGNEDRMWKRKGFLKRNADPTHAGASVPAPRLCHTAIVCNNKMHVFGGHNTETDSQRFSEVKSDVYSFDLAKQKWERWACKNVPAKTEHSTVSYDNKLWLFGGYSGHTFSNSLYMLDTSTSQCSLVKTSGEVPSGRSAHVGTIYGSKFFLFGGWDGISQYNDFFSLDIPTMIWAKISTAGGTPHPRCSHTSAVSESRKEMYIFGGYGGKDRNYLNDLWSYNFETKIWTQLVGKGSAPSPRSRMRMVEWNEKLYIFGGWDRAVHFDELFEYDIATSTWTTIDIFALPKDDSLKIGQHSMVVHSNILYIFGGFNQKLKKSTNDLYSYRLGKSIRKTISHRDKPYEKEGKSSRLSYKLSKFDCSNEIEIEA